ncbi:hypothetical protein KA047_00320 [Candidatus Saccharibacteria bacterium]|nr:hypothetical protein [Candidatus Saccharibacteria bacterium]
MERLSDFTAGITQPELCATCPRRGFTNRVIAKLLLGSEHAGTDCNPEAAVRDGDLKNYLYNKGLVDSPYGISTMPDDIEHGTLGLSGSPRAQVIHAAGSIKYGLNDYICAQDVPELYNGNFVDFIESIKESEL